MVLGRRDEHAVHPMVRNYPSNHLEELGHAWQAHVVTVKVGVQAVVHVRHIVLNAAEASTHATSQKSSASVIRTEGR